MNGIYRKNVLIFVLIKISAQITTNSRNIINFSAQITSLSVLVNRGRGVSISGQWPAVHRGISPLFPLESSVFPLGTTRFCGLYHFVWFLQWTDACHDITTFSGSVELVSVAWILLKRCPVFDLGSRYITTFSVWIISFSVPDELPSLMYAEPLARLRGVLLASEIEFVYWKALFEASLG